MNISLSNWLNIQLEIPENFRFPGDLSSRRDDSQLTGKQKQRRAQQ
jgi:hypothetical protein